MSENAADDVRLLVCPKCRSRREAPAGIDIRTLRCRQCATTLDLVAGGDSGELKLRGPDVAIASTGGGQSIELDAEIHVGPPPLPPPKVKDLQLSSTKSAAGNPATPAKTPAAPTTDDHARAPSPLSLGAAFFTGVFTFPFWPAALAQWLVVSLGFMGVGKLAQLSASALAMGGYAGGVSGGVYAFAAFFLMLLAGSYAAASAIDIIVNTAYGLDTAQDWPDPDWRDRLFTFIRVMYWGGVAALPAAAVSAIASPVAAALDWPDLVAPACLATLFVCFPIVLLSALETTSTFAPFSKAIAGSLLTAWHAWALFYVLSAMLLAGWLALIEVSTHYSEAWAPVFTGPPTAAAVFIYARLLGRLSRYIIQQHDAEAAHKGGADRKRHAPA